MSRDSQQAFNHPTLQLPPLAYWATLSIHLPRMVYHHAPLTNYDLHKRKTTLFTRKMFLIIRRYKGCQNSISFHSAREIKRNIFDFWSWSVICEPSAEDIDAKLLSTESFKNGVTRENWPKRQVCSNSRARRKYFELFDIYFMQSMKRWKKEMSIFYGFAVEVIIL